MRILVIEDSLFLRHVIERVLQKCGHDVRSAADGLKGLQAASDASTDLILLDMMLPGLDGTSVLRKLKEDPRTSDIPVVVLTSLSTRNAETLKSAGATAFVEKSALSLDKNGDGLIQVVDHVLALQKKQPSLR